MRSPFLASFGCAALLAVCSARPALAEGADCARPPSTHAVESAQSAFREGQRAFSEGDYQRAIELWQQAYQSDCTAHALLLNLATAQELSGRDADAIASLRAFNERAPDSSYHEPNARRIERLEQRIAERSVRSAPPDGVHPLPPEAPRGAHAMLTPALAAAAHPTRTLARPEQTLHVVPTTSAGMARPPLDDAAPEGTSRSLLPLGLAAGGAVAAVVGGIVYVNGRRDVERAERACGGARVACSDAQAALDGESARARAQVGGWITGAGAAAIVTGVAWYFLQPTAERRPNASRRPLRWQATLDRERAFVGALGTF